jgi:F0F1-type ATP synthase assembly protein I
MKYEEDGNKGSWQGMVEYGSIGVELAASVFIGAFIGYRIDLYLHTEPYFMVSGLMLGAAAGFYSLYNIAVKAERRSKDK